MMLNQPRVRTTWCRTWSRTPAASHQGPTCTTSSAKSSRAWRALLQADSTRSTTPTRVRARGGGGLAGFESVAVAPTLDLMKISIWGAAVLAGAALLAPGAALGLPEKLSPDGRAGFA